MGREANSERMMKSQHIGCLGNGLLYILSNWHVMNNTTIIRHGVEICLVLATQMTRYMMLLCFSSRSWRSHSSDWFQLDGTEYLYINYFVASFRYHKKEIRCYVNWVVETVVTI